MGPLLGPNGSLFSVAVKPRPHLTGPGPCRRAGGRAAGGFRVLAMGLGLFQCKATSDGALAAFEIAANDGVSGHVVASYGVEPSGVPDLPILPHQSGAWRIEIRSTSQSYTTGPPWRCHNVAKLHSGVATINMKKGPEGPKIKRPACTPWMESPSY